jgi:hypothetical protein
MTELLREVWKQQTAYNIGVKKIQDRSSSEWMETYILGLMSECGQLLDAMRWKRNRLQSIEEFGPNVPEELADITKFVFSMWILMGSSPEDMLRAVYTKGILLDTIFSQEFNFSPKSKVVVFDLDNVLADTQTALAEYMGVEKALQNIHLDIAANLSFDEYRDLKNQFEKLGGYRHLAPIYDTVELFDFLRASDCSIVVWTARPVAVFKRIRQDTIDWFFQQGAQPDAIFYGREQRIPYLADLRNKGHKVVLVEDDPGLILRAKMMKIPTIVPYRLYNTEYANFDGDSEIALAEYIERNL